MPPEVDTITSQLYKSLSRLKIKKIYGFLAHRPLNLYNNPSQWEELNNLKSSGVINKIGFSLNETSELDKLLDIGIIPDLIQAPFNYFDRRFNKQMAELKAKGCEIHARSVFLQGLFFANTNNLSSYFYEVTSIIRALQDSTPFLSGSLLKFVIEQPFIDKVIIGVENPNQLLMNLEFMDKSSTLPELFTHIPERILVPSKWPQ